MPHFLHLILACCGIEVPVLFDERDYPIGAPTEFKKNISCPRCDSLIIATLTKENDRTTLDQEVIKL